MSTIEIVNRNGEVVDLAALAKERENDGGGPFGEELRRRAAGMEREEELLAMLAAMDGKWCSRRKKRRVVQACLLGDALPVGWKLIIALRRRGGKFFPYCRRYISPTGEQLASCKEVSSYLQSYFGINDTSILRDSGDVGEHDLHQQRVDSDKPMPINSEDGNCMLDFPNSTIPNACVPNEPEKDDVSVLGIDNLPDVQVSDLYECHPCNVSFDVKDKYLQHLMSSHQKTTRRYRVGSSVGAGVIVRDGKFECQFCHKVFEERRRYLGHVGNHVRGPARRSEVSLGNTRLPCTEQMPANASISRMDALIEIAQSSIQDFSPSNLSNVDEVSLVENSSAMDADFKTERSYSLCINEDESMEGKSLPEELNLQNSPSEICEAYAVETKIEKNSGEDNASSEELNPPCDNLSEISMTDRDIVNNSNACFDDLEMGKGDGKHRCSSEELNIQGKVREISMSDENMTCSSACPKELGMEKDYEEGKTLPEELDPCDWESDGEGNEQSFTFDTTIVPTTATGLHAENTKGNHEWECTAPENNRSAIEPKEMLDVHYLLYNEKPSAMDGAEEMINYPAVAEPELEHAQAYDAKELARAYASSPFDEIFAKETQNISSLDQSLGSVITPEYMKLDEADTQMYNMTGEDFVSLSAISMGFELSAQGGPGLDASIGSQSQFSMDIAHESVTTTVCVWCGAEFCHKVIDIELQPDTVGFMCPACRNKISKQFNDLESNFSLNHHYC